MPFIAQPGTWPYKELRGMDGGAMLQVLLQAERAYGSGKYAAAAAAPTVKSAKSAPVFLLSWPVKS